MRSAVLGALAPLGLAELGQQQRQLDVLARREHRDQVEELEDEADVRGAERASSSSERSFSMRPATLTWPSWPVEAGEQVQQRGLAGARGPHQRDEAAALGS